MARLDITLFGSLQVSRDGRSVNGLAYDKVRALLAYLAVEADRPYRREALAALFWPDRPDDAARHGLSQALTTLRHAIGDGTAAPPFLLVSHDAIGFNPASDHWVDVTAFTGLLATCNQHRHRHLAKCAACAERLTAAAAIYSGDFLAGFSPNIGEEFEHWVLSKREELRRACLDALAHLAEYHERRSAFEPARAAIQRQLALDPWREAAHRQLIRLLWLNGERSAALAQYEHIRRTLVDELGVEPETETTALYQEVRTSRSDAAAARTTWQPSGPKTSDLPEPLTPLLGRAQELERISAMLADPECRLLTLVGPGGIGKTRLAIQVVREQTALFADGVAYVSLAPVSDVSLLMPSIAQALGIALHDRADPVEQILNRVRDWQMLLVLDNFEHLLDGAIHLNRLLGFAPELKLLVTSREWLNVHGEWRFDVRGLGIPNDGDPVTGAEHGAIQLFETNLRRVRSQAPVQADDWDWIARICRLVEGMPLALELAAVWAAVLTLPEIAREIERNLGFLTTSRRDVAPQHRSMQAVFDHSWRLLSEEEREVFCRLSVFRGGFSRPAAEAVAGASLPILLALVSKSLLRVSAVGRYDMHELLRQYGAEHLARDPEIDRATHAAHGALYLDFVAQRASAMTGFDQDRVLAEIDAELDNVRVAWRWATTGAHAEEIARSARGLWLFDLTRGRIWEGADAFDQAMEGLQATPDLSVDRRLALAQALVYRGGHRCRLGRFDLAADLLTQGVALLRPLDAPSDLGLALNLLATTLHAQGRYTEEEATLHESLAYFRQASDDWGAAYSLNDLGMVAHLQGQYELASQRSRESLALSRTSGDRRAQSLAHHNLGIFAAHADDQIGAEREHTASLELRRATNDEWGIAVSLIQTSRLSRLRGEREDAEHDLLAALRIAIEGSVLPITLDALFELAALAAGDGRYARASTMFAAILAHPALNQSLREPAERQFAELTAHHPDESAGHAAETALTVEELARALLLERSYRSHLVSSDQQG